MCQKKHPEALLAKTMFGDDYAAAFSKNITSIKTASLLLPLITQHMQQILACRNNHMNRNGLAVMNHEHA